MKRTVQTIIIGLLIIIGISVLVTPAFAQFTPGEPHWQFDPQVTQVGRNAERARELIYWVYSNPPLFHHAVLKETHIIVRNIALVLTVLVIIGLALHLLLTSRKIGPTFTGISVGLERLNLASIIIRLVAIVLFIWFSYTIVLGFINGAELMTKFIQTIAGEDLFTVVFTPNSNSEENYTFVGYRNYDPYEQDMVFTSLFLVRLTSFTYNFMSVILIMRHIVLMFLLIIAPLLGLLMAFIFIRNTGYIWIAEFFRWLLYGPMFTLFIVSLAKIWKAGIPYPFDFSRATEGTVNNQVYHTAINILYGGPGQVQEFNRPLSPSNTSNYIDTYAEYVIALIMLWTAILLPWLLLRIFRDYCCDILEKNHGTLMQILDRMRNIAPPTPPPVKPGPASTTGQKLDVNLPFRQKVQPPQRTGVTRSSEVTRERIIEKINNNEIKTVETHELQKVYDLQVESLKDVARLEMQKETSTAVTDTLQKIQNPFTIKEEATRKQFETLRTEFTQRAAQGDKIARQIVEAATPKASQIKESTKEISSQVLREAVKMPGRPVAISGKKDILAAAMTATNQSVLKSVAEKTNTTAERVEEVLKAVPQTEQTKQERVTVISERVAVPRQQVQKVLDAAPKDMSADTIASATMIKSISEQTDVSTEKVEEILKENIQTERTKEERVSMISEKLGASRSEVEKIVDTASIENISMSTMASSISEKTDVSSEKVEQVLSDIAETERSQEERITTISERIAVPREQVQQIVAAVPEGTSAEQISSNTIVKTVSEKTQISEGTVEQVLQQVPQTIQTKEETISAIAEKTEMSTDEVERIVATVESEKIAKDTIIQTISEKTSVSTEKIEQILKENAQVVPVTEKTHEHQITMISEKVGIAQEQVRRIGETASAESSTGELPTVTPTVIKSVSEKTSTSEEQVKQVLTELSQKEVSTEEKVSMISEKVGVSAEQIREVLDSVPIAGIPETAAPAIMVPIVTPATIQKVSEETKVEESKVEKILGHYSQISGTREEKEQQIAEELAVAPEEVQKVIGATPMQEAPTSEGPEPETPVSIEDYEEVRHMWMNHYKNTEVPVSDTVKDRTSWIDEDIKTLTNTLDLLTSETNKNRKRGMEQVSTILPFLLLGGFSDVETITYIKAKLEAAKLVRDEVLQVDKVREEMKSTEEFVEVTDEKKEKAATMTIKNALEQPKSDEEASEKESSESPSTIAQATTPEDTSQDEEEKPKEPDLDRIPTIEKPEDTSSNEPPAEEEQKDTTQESEEAKTEKPEDTSSNEQPTQVEPGNNQEPEKEHAHDESPSEQPHVAPSPVQPTEQDQELPAEESLKAVTEMQRPTGPPQDQAPTDQPPQEPSNHPLGDNSDKDKPMG